MSSNWYESHGIWFYPHFPQHPSSCTCAQHLTLPPLLPSFSPGKKSIHLSKCSEIISNRRKISAYRALSSVIKSSTILTVSVPSLDQTTRWNQSLNVLLSSCQRIDFSQEKICFSVRNKLWNHKIQIGESSLQRAFHINPLYTPFASTDLNSASVPVFPDAWV